MSLSSSLLSNYMSLFCFISQIMSIKKIKLSILPPETLFWIFLFSSVWLHIPKPFRRLVRFPIIWYNLLVKEIRNRQIADLFCESRNAIGEGDL